MTHTRGRPRAGTAVLRTAAVILLLVSSLVSVARAAPSASEVAQAEARAEALLDDVRDARAELATLTAKSAKIAGRLQLQQNEIDRIVADIDAAQTEVERLRDRADEISARLSDRAAEAYMAGPATAIESFMSSASIAELSDRIEFIDAVAQADATLATEASKARVLLEYRVEDLSKLRSAETEVLAGLEADNAALLESLDRQSSLLREIEQKEDEAAAYAKLLGREWRDYQESLLGAGGGSGGGIFRVCPVDQPRVLTDSFGAPRYVGGYHPHKGVDIMAPGGTPIRAPFDGYARNATNSIGGIAVIVEGGSGYVYNAHMSRLGQLGSVRAGDVIGYVGMTGASGAGVNHDHFEYHPKSLPSSWPASGYGYSIIDDAVNPYPLLVAAC
jgi:murein DD-endopeptidase MepM/ murein hydrolase activator NlpD